MSDRNKLDRILESLERIDFPEDQNTGNDLETLSDSLRRMVTLGERLGKAEFRASQNAEHIGDRLDALEEQLQSQLASREEELKSERQKIGEYEEEVHDLVVGLIQIADLISAGRGAARQETDQPGRDLIARLADEIEKILRRLGLEPLASKGDQHDAQFHEPVARESTPEADSREILEVVKQGYRYNGRVLRVAKVVIAE
jgi:molecular chaperone GrpE